MQTIKISGDNAEIQQILKEHKENTIFEFEERDYYFSPHDAIKADYNLSNTDEAEFRILGLLLKDMKNCVLQGNGARLWFSGHMQPFTLDHCEQLTVRGFTIDWEKPMVAEGVVVDSGEDWVTLTIDPDKFPYRYTGDWLEFDIGADEWYPLCEVNCQQYEPDSLCIRRNTDDTVLLHPIQKVGENMYRIPTAKPYDGVPGNIVVLRHNMRKHSGIFMEMCLDISVEDIVVHSCGGLGCLSQFCHNVRFDNVHFLPNTKLGRKVVNGRDDGMHITGNSGKVEITNCSFVGLMDDPINVHGCSVAVDEVVDERTLRCSYRHPQAMGFLQWAKKGDEISLINRRDMSSVLRAKTEAYCLETRETFTISFQEKLPQEVLELAGLGESMALENLTNTPEFYCAQNRFGSCRARGILVSTPKRVVIEKNYFESSGAAILIPGDSNYWFESGACHDVTIQNNVFTNRCNGSRYEFCQGIISICPVVPEPNIEKPFHSNIKIHNNVFDIAGGTVVYALSCDKLQIQDNLIFQSAICDHVTEWKLTELEFCSNLLVN